MSTSTPSPSISEAPIAQEPAAKKPAKKTPAYVIRGWSIFAVFAVLTFFLMANEGQLWHGPLYGILTMLVAVGGLLDALGMLRPARDTTDLPAAKLFGAHDGEPDWMSPKATVPLALAVLVGGSVVFGFHQLPVILVLTLVVLGLSALRRPALLVFVIGSLIILPTLGSYGLWDPWETHYGEVAREILSRDDWISLWWAHENWFMSKPIFIFWFEALTMGVLGFNYHPDGNPAHPEWALRLPIYIVAIGALLAIYAAISRTFGKRAGVVCATVIATMPHFFLLSHQAITDMHFVGTMMIAMACFMLAVAEDPAREVKEYRIGPFVWSGRHTMIAGFTMLALPQALYLASRNVVLQSGFLFAWHRDQFVWGSRGNAGTTPETSLAANKMQLATNDPAFNGILAQPMAQALIWAAGLAVILFFFYREKRARSLYMFAFYVFCGLAFMAKGIPGFALPGLVALLYLIASRRWKLLLDGHLRVALGMLIVCVVGLPWFVAMYMRHGPAFTDRLLIHDHLARLTSGVHGDNGPIDYFMAQMGPGMFPWIALAPVALTIFLHMTTKPNDGLTTHDGETLDPRREATTLIALWFVAAFVLFNAMVTKFHHYIFPAVPPVAILVGLVVNQMLGDTEEMPLMKRVGATAAGFGAALCFVLGIGGFIGNIRGVIPFETPAADKQDWILDHGWGAGISILLLVVGVGLGVLAVILLRNKEKTESAIPTWQIAGVGTALACAPVVAAFVGRDLSWVTTQHPYGYERLIHLFVYNYGRPWPDVFDYRPILTGFGVSATVFLVLAVFRVLRPVATRALIGVAFLFGVWSLDVYLMDLSPHWSQKGVIARYYELRHSPDDPIIAWQMNWKGENFYTGNRVEAFVDLDNAKFRQWLEHNRGKHAYVLVENGRVESLRSFLAPRTVTAITSARDNNKFMMVEVTI